MDAALLRRWVIGFVAALAALSTTARSAAQGQAFPPPISTDALERSLGRYVKPGPESREAIQAAHDQYLENYRRLQDAELESFAKERPPMLTGGDMGAWMRRFGSLRGRVVGLDTTLFESIRQSLPEEKRAGIDRLRWVREAEVLRTGFMGEMGGFAGPGRARLSDLVYSAGLDDEDLARIDPLLRDYQQRHLTVVRKSVDESERLFTEFGDRLKKEGLWGPVLEEAQRDPERAMELYRRMSGLVKETFTGVLLENAKVGESTTKAAAQIRDALSWEGRMKFTPEWLSSAYPSLGHRFPRFFLAEARRAKQLVGEQTPTAETIDRIVRDTMDRALPALDTACKAEDAAQMDMMLAQFSRMDEDGGETAQETFQRQQQEREKHLEQVDRIVAAGAEAIHAQLPPEVVEKLRSPTEVEGAPVMGAAVPVPTEVVQAEEDASVVEMDPVNFSVDTVASRLQPYSVASLQQFLTSIGASEEQRTAITMLHGDYLARHTETVAPKRAAYDQSRMELYTPQDDGTARLDALKAERSAAVLRDLVASTRELDEEFFSTVAAALGAEQADSVRVERLGRVTAAIGRVGQQMWVYSPNAEQAPDLVAVVRDAALSDAERRAAAAAIAPHADAIEAAVIAAFHAVLDANLRMERLQSELFAAMRSPEEQTRAAMEWQRKSTEIQAAPKAAIDARRAANTAALDAVTRSLSETSRSAVQRNWSQASYPSVFKDPKALFSVFEKVERLPDLSDEQRERVKAALDEYRSNYEIACDAMLAASLKEIPQAKEGQMGAEYWMAIQERERSISRMRFERDETSARAASALRRILTEEQLAQFPRLADPSKTKAPSNRPW